MATFALSRLVGKILTKAVRHAYAVRRLTITLTLDRAQAHVIHIVPTTPTQNRDNLLELIQLQLQAHPPQAQIVAAQLNAEPAKPQRIQQGLFQSQFPEPDRLDLLIARLRSIAGEHNVGSATLANSHQEDAFLLENFQPECKVSEAPTVVARSALRVFRPRNASVYGCRMNAPTSASGVDPG